MTAAGAIDMRCEARSGDAHRCAGFGGYVEDLASPGGSPWPGDGGSAGAEPRRWPCVPWGPSIHSLSQAEELIGHAGGWRGMVRATLGHPGAGAALAEWSIGPLATALADGGVPLAIDLADPGVDLGCVFALAVAHPTLAIVLRTDRRFDPALVLALLAAVANVTVETSGIDRAAVLDALALDPARLVFGSAFPANDPAAELDLVASWIDDPALLDQVVVGNATRLLEQNRP